MLRYNLRHALASLLITFALSLTQPVLAQNVISLSIPVDSMDAGQTSDRKGD